VLGGKGVSFADIGRACGIVEYRYQQFIGFDIQITTFCFGENLSGDVRVDKNEWRMA
jgi:hypothetical protein